MTSSVELTGPRAPVSQPGSPAPSRARRPLSGTDGATVLSFYIFLLVALPARYVFAPLGAAGTPAQMIAMAIALWWASQRLSRTRPLPRAPQPIMRAMVGFTGCMVISYLVASTRAIDIVEMNATDRALLSMLGWLGVMLVAGDLIPRLTRVDALLRRAVVLGAGLAALGLVQFRTGQSFTQYLKLPGLIENDPLTSVLGRDGLNRPAGTAVHPIEFGVVITMLLPIALHYAFVDRDRSIVRRWLPVAIIAVAVPASVSRSSILCTAVVLAFLLPTWEKKVRRLAYGAMTALMGLVFVGMPGMLGTLIRLFSGINEDRSALSRTDSYTTAWEFISRTPVFGRGFATFLPVYRILDNQYLGSLIELGVVGLTSLIILFATGVVTALRIRRSCTDPRTRSLALSLGSSLAAGAVSFAFFDAFAFSMLSGMMFFTLGMINSVHQLHATGGTTRAADPAGRRPGHAGPGAGPAAAEPGVDDPDDDLIDGMVARHAGSRRSRWRRVKRPAGQPAPASDLLSPAPEAAMPGDGAAVSRLRPGPESTDSPASLPLPRAPQVKADAGHPPSDEVGGNAEGGMTPVTAPLSLDRVRALAASAASVPDTDVPDTDVPDTEVPDTEVPDGDVPDTEVPDGDVPERRSSPETGPIPVDRTGVPARVDQVDAAGEPFGLNHRDAGRESAEAEAAAAASPEPTVDPKAPETAPLSLDRIGRLVVPEVPPAALPPAPAPVTAPIPLPGITSAAQEPEAAAPPTGPIPILGGPWDPASVGDAGAEGQPDPAPTTESDVDPADGEASPRNDQRR